jgi:hypothetical protein
MISSIKSNKRSTLAAESHRQRQQHNHNQYPTHRANRDTTMAPSTPKASKTGPSTDDRRTPTYSTPKRRGTPKRGGKARIVHSPLIDAPPMPNPSAKDAKLITPRDRWRAMSELAGSHKQPLELLDLSNRSLPAQALKFGVPRKAAESITCLRYDGNLVGEGDDGNNDLPAFLDIVVQLFPRLQHLSLTNNPCSGECGGGVKPIARSRVAV